MSSDPNHRMLIEARDRVKAVLAEYDMAYHVMLHLPGHIEVFSNLHPTYSRATITEVDGNTYEVRLKSHLADYYGDQEAQRRDLEATANMLSSMSQVMGENAMHLIRISEYVDQALGAKHIDLGRFEEAPP